MSHKKFKPTKPINPKFTLEGMFDYYYEHDELKRPFRNHPTWGYMYYHSWNLPYYTVDIYGNSYSPFSEYAPKPSKKRKQIIRRIIAPKNSPLTDWSRHCEKVQKTEPPQIYDDLPF